jgi:glycosidase
VFNHCGIGHWAFKDVIEKQEASRYINWFSVESFPVTPHPVPNYKTCSGCWYLPKWNAYNPEVRKHHHDVTRYWIEQGIDGWRLDVPYFINENFWRGFRTIVKDIDPDLYIVAEEWREPESWLKGDLADGTMNYTLRNLIFGFTAERNLDAETFAGGMTALRTSIPAGARRGMLNLLGSHDTTRLLTHYKEDARAAIVALTLMITSEGAPMIYYGDEIGMQGENDPGCRQTMEWDESRWNGDLLAGIKDLLWLRRNHPVLQSGDDQVMALSPDVVARVRRLGDERAMVVANRGATEVRVPAGLFEGGNWTTSSGQLIEPGQIAEGVAVAPMSAAIYFGKGPVA